MGRVFKGFTDNEMSEILLNGTVYNFSSEFISIGKGKIYLMSVNVCRKKHNMKQYSGSSNWYLFKFWYLFYWYLSFGRPSTVENANLYL